jgi:hypothetical protein
MRPTRSEGREPQTSAAADPPRSPSRSPSDNGEAKEPGTLARWGPWNRRSIELAVYFEERWQVRSDVFGGYYADGAGKVRTTTVTGPDRQKIPLTRGIILRHCRARKTEEVVGLHTTAWMAAMVIALKIRRGNTDRAALRERVLSKSVPVAIREADDVYERETLVAACQRAVDAALDEAGL